MYWNSYDMTKVASEHLFYGIISLNSVYRDLDVIHLVHFHTNQSSTSE